MLRRRGARREEEGLRESLLSDDDRFQATTSEQALEQEGREDGVVASTTALEESQIRLQEMVEAIRVNILFFFTKISQCCLWLVPATAKAPKLSLLQLQRLDDLRDRIALPYDGENEEHLVALRKLWRAAFNDPPPQGPIKSPQWKEMGWQGEDPGTDFRGAGLLALENLLHLAYRHTDTFTTLMNKGNGTRSELEYPFAAAGCNITFLLVELLDLRDGSRLPKSQAGRNFLRYLADSPLAFEELYVVAFQVLDEVWLQMKASYMDFPKVLAEMKTLVEAAIVKCADSVEDVRKELCVATVPPTGNQ